MEIWSEVNCESEQNHCIDDERCICVSLIESEIQKKKKIWAELAGDINKNNI